ncbi:MAG: hypothetical protein ACYCW6_15155 [Candidatus Xenobia bacterium]
MSFWDDIREEAVAQQTASDVARELQEKLAATGINRIASIKPAYYLAQMAGLTWDFIDYSEALLAALDGEPDTALRLLVFLRENGRSIMTTIKDAGEPMERLISLLEEELEAETPEDGEEATPDLGADLDADRETQSTNREQLERRLREALTKVGVGLEIARQLATRVADLYAEGVQFHRELNRLRGSKPADVPVVLATLIDLQFVLDIQMRNLLMEDFSLEMEPTFSTGFFTWSSQALGDLNRLVREKAPA